MRRMTRSARLLLAALVGAALALALLLAVLWPLDRTPRVTVRTEGPALLRDRVSALDQRFSVKQHGRRVHSPGARACLMRCRRP